MILFWIVEARNNYHEQTLYQGLISSPCTRILNAQGTVGLKPNTVGELYPAYTKQQMDQFLSNNGGPYTLLTTHLLLDTYLDQLQSSKQLAGVLLSTDGFGTARPQQYSPGPKCPNCDYGLSQYPWNPQGTELGYKSIGFPVFELSQNISKQIINQALSNFTSSSVFSVQFDATMTAGRDSTTCLRQSRCLPIKSSSVWSTFSADIQKDDNKPIIFLTSKLDGNAFIRDLAYGASQKTGVATVLATMAALSRVAKTLPKHIIFGFFNSETWAFGGSQRFVKDISQPFQCTLDKGEATDDCQQGAKCSNPCFLTTDFAKINFQKIEAILDFDTVGSFEKQDMTQSQLFMHADDPQLSSNLLNTFKIGNFTNYNGSSLTAIGLQPAFGTTNNKLPPSAAMAFLQKRQIPALVFSDYQSQFSNPYFESEFDDGSQWGAAHVTQVCALANSVAQGVYKLAAGTDAPPTVSVDCQFVDQLMGCLTRNMTCQIYQGLVPNITFGSTKLSSYAFLSSIGIYEDFVGRLSANLTGTLTQKQCKYDSECPTYCINQQCVSSMTRFHDAYGTGIEWDYTNHKWHVVDPTKGTWTESYWDSTRIRIFKQANNTFQIIELVVGIVLTLCAIGISVLHKMYF